MDWFIVVVGALLLGIATPIALWWWRLARNAAPYRDEKRSRPPVEKKDDSEVVIIRTPDERSSRP